MILLTHSYYLGRDPKQLARGRPYAPLATLLAAATLRGAGHQVSFFDAMLAPDIQAFRAALAQHRPRVVAIVEDSFNYVTKMCTLQMREAALEMIAVARAGGCRIVVSGSDASDHPMSYLEAGADAVILGDVEATLLAVADSLRDCPGASLAAVSGLALGVVPGAVTRTPPRSATRDLDTLPLPAWDLVDVAPYRQRWMSAHGRFSWNMVTSRGCPFGCNWCAKPLFGRRYTQRSAAGVAEEMRRLKDEIAPDHIWFADDIFGLTPRWIEQFAAEVIRRNARIPFMIQCRVDLLQSRVVAALAEAGAEEVWLGVESGSQRILDAMEKGTTVEQTRAATRTLRDHGIRACWFLQLGYPPEVWEDLVRTRDLVRDERPDDIGVSVAYPLPGTKFHASVGAQLGARENWQDSGELAMLFRGAYSTAFYRQLRDALHHEVSSGVADDARWTTLHAAACGHEQARPAAG
jgi:anaerobic magnesium-protoporphyrin IX monomethyl ester cyclase